MLTRQTRTMDRRVTKTKAAIQKAFFTLLEDHEYSEITVTALAREANIDRKTFYTHYRTLDDVLDDIAHDTVAYLIDQIDLVHFFDDVETNAQRFFTALNALLEEREIMGITHRKVITRDKFLQIWSRQFNDALVAKAQITITSKRRQILDLTIQYYSGGLFSLYQAWLDAGKPISIQKLSQLASTNILFGLTGTHSKLHTPVSTAQPSTTADKVAS